MKRVLLNLAFLGLSLAATAQADGGGSTGGGGAWVCRESTGKREIRWAKLIDLWEAPSLMDVVLEEPAADVEAELYRVKNKLCDQASFDFVVRFVAELAHVQKRVKFARPDGELERVFDANYTHAPKRSSCAGGYVHVEQVANYMPERLYLDREIFDALGPQDQAALYVHETTYSLYRKHFGAKTSDQARTLTALLFSDPAQSADYSKLMLQPIFQAYVNFEGSWKAGYAKVSISYRQEGLQIIEYGDFLVSRSLNFKMDLVLNAYCLAEEDSIILGKDYCSKALRINPRNPDELEFFRRDKSGDLLPWYVLNRVKK